MSEFLIAITRVDGSRVLLKPGGLGERALVAEVTRAAVAKGVGFLKTEAQVAEAIRAGFREVLHAMKSEVQPR